MTLSRRILLLLYSSATAALLLCASPWWVWRLLRTGRYREGLPERLGRIPARLRLPGRSRAVWVHAVSVGEVLAAGRLVDELTAALPTSLVYLSTTTRTGQALARERFGAERVFFFPLDFACSMRPWLRVLRPALVVLVESELWPRMLLECAQAGIPVAVVNARISDRSWPRYRLLRPLWAPLLRTLSLVLAQSQADAMRLRALGAQRVLCPGNLKYDIAPPPHAPFAQLLEASLPPGAMLVVCGSTLAGEEALLLGALPLHAVITVLAPRHPERFRAVAQLLAARGIPYVQRSQWSPDSVQKLQPGTVLLLDSIGELASVYALAAVAIVGGGFLFAGGHNPLEPARFGVPVIAGPGYANFREIVDSLLRAEAILLAGEAELAETIAGLLRDTEARMALGARARRVFQEQAGATARTLAALLPLLGEAPAAAHTGDARQLDEMPQR